MADIIVIAHLVTTVMLVVLLGILAALGCRIIQLLAELQSRLVPLATKTEGTLGQVQLALTDLQKALKDVRNFLNEDLPPRMDQTHQGLQVVIGRAEEVLTEVSKIASSTNETIQHIWHAPGRMAQTVQEAWPFKGKKGTGEMPAALPAAEEALQVD